MTLCIRISILTNFIKRSNRRMKLLVGWLSSPHWTPDTGMLTYLLLRDDSCPVQRCFKEFTSHQLDLSRPTVHVNFVLIASEAHVWHQVIYCQVLITLNPASQHTCFTPCHYSSAAVTPTEWQPAPTILQCGFDCQSTSGFIRWLELVFINLFMF